ncbi:MAG TPA: mycofactocin precursor MftA [Mycobacteriales bacterium]|nr:mycofactocin precursor MftA [Mycobacteriales bacterium]
MTPPAAAAPSDTAETVDDPSVVADADVLADLLVEEISIDGMCGVY